MRESATQEIVYMIKQKIAAYEAMHGEIKLKKKNLMTKTNLEKRLYEIEEQQRKEKAMEQARNERNYNNYLRRKERYERQAHRQSNNQVPITAVIYAIVLILVIVCICLANQGYNVLDIIRYFIEKTIEEGASPLPVCSRFYLSVREPSPRGVPGG